MCASSGGENLRLPQKKSEKRLKARLKSRVVVCRRTSSTVAPFRSNSKARASVALRESAQRKARNTLDKRASSCALSQGEKKRKAFADCTTVVVAALLSQQMNFAQAPTRDADAPLAPSRASSALSFPLSQLCLLLSTAQTEGACCACRLLPSSRLSFARRILIFAQFFQRLFRCRPSRLPAMQCKCASCVHSID